MTRNAAMGLNSSPDSRKEVSGWGVDEFMSEIHPEKEEKVAGILANWQRQTQENREQRSAPGFGKKAIFQAPLETANRERRMAFTAGQESVEFRINLLCRRESGPFFLDFSLRRPVMRLKIEKNWPHFPAMLATIT
ncbi:hypothetical protein [Thiolapillus sp.]